MSNKYEVESGGGYEHGSGLLANPDMQIDPGYFLLRQNGQQVGRAFTSRRGDEHWELFGSYIWPSRRSGPVVLVIEPTTVNVPADDAAFRSGIRQGSVYLHLKAV